MKNGSYIGYDREIGCSWVTFQTGSLYWEKNTNGTPRTCVITLTQNESNKKMYIRIHQAGEYTFKWDGIDNTNVQDTVNYNAGSFNNGWSKTRDVISEYNYDKISWSATTDVSWITPTWNSSTGQTKFNRRIFIKNCLNIIIKLLFMLLLLRISFFHSLNPIKIPFTSFFFSFIFILNTLIKFIFF